MAKTERVRSAKRIVLDIDDTFDAVHGGQQLRRFNAHYDEYGYQPIVVFDGDGRLVGAVLRPAKRPNGREIAGHLRRLIREIRARWPRAEIMLGATSKNVLQGLECVGPLKVADSVATTRLDIGAGHLDVPDEPGPTGCVVVCASGLHLPDVPAKQIARYETKTRKRYGSGFEG